MSTRSDESFGEGRLTWVDRWGVWLSQRRIRRFVRGHDLVALDLGCGYYATQLRALRNRLRQSTGVDLRIAPHLRADPTFSFLEGRIEHVLPQLPNQTFDLVMLISVLEHLEDPQSALNAAWRVSRPGGVLLVNVPTWRGKVILEYSAFRLGLSPAVEMNDHKMYYDKRDLWPLLVRAGYAPRAMTLRYHKFGLNLFAAATKTIDA